ncbi:hypothetical protein [Halomonas huangheensis]|uniref:Preprotein translocase subunit SecD n=1 Tax=Halomonas huangheensis TaxID=1178482 RepID=W1N368_9GAMM|nr:hypothetical protein [Halomonas huangheensis]ALM51474.1 preprotein translocase subunit SecD [Halomonas huangheensis]ERL49929.1 hypothetical protein BJB45_02050 [Halomonas huangheensis]
MRAEDILADDQQQVERRGVTIRKGSVGAFLANARILSDASTDAEKHARAERDILGLLPALQALGLFEVFAIRDATLARLVENALSPLDHTATCKDKR